MQYGGRLPFKKPLTDDEAKQGGVPTADTSEIYNYLLQYGAHADIANATRHMARYVKTCHAQNWK